MPRHRRFTYSIVVAAVFALGHTSVLAQMQSKTPAESVELIGRPVLAADGTQVAEVADVSAADDDHIDRIRVRAERPMGIGERIVEIPEETFTILNGVVVLQLSAKEFRLVPAVPDATTPD